MNDENTMYLDAKVDNPTPQQLFPGCDGIYNWFSLSEEEKALNGWVKFDPPSYDELTETIEIKTHKDKRGVYSVTYNVVSKDTTESVVNHFKGLVSTKRWKEETSGTKVEGIDFVVPTTAEAVAKIASIVTSYAQNALAKDAVVDFNVGPNTVQLNKERTQATYAAVTAHVQTCHSRQAEMFKEIDKIAGYKTKNAKHLQEYVNSEIDKGWPVIEPTPDKSE